MKLQSTLRRMLFSITLCLLVTTSVAQESARERQDRVYQEEQRSRDNAAYLSNWRGNQNHNQYAAIAYSEKTGRWGFGVGYNSLAGARQEALRRCGQSDARILCWSQNGSYCAFAQGPNSYGAAYGSTAEQARARAMANASSVAPGARVVVCIQGLQ